MLLSTYKLMRSLFQQNRGYMNANELRLGGITSNQIRELVDEGELICYSRGCYWNNECGFTRPDKHKYFEICKADARAVICAESAAYLHGIFSEEPEVVAFAAPRDDRKKMKFIYPVRRIYAQKDEMQGDIMHMDFDGYRVAVFDIDRTVVDYIRLKEEENETREKELASFCRERYSTEEQKKRLLAYASRLHAFAPVKEFVAGLSENENS